jgi:hypothetical protein
VVLGLIRTDAPLCHLSLHAAGGWMAVTISSRVAFSLRAHSPDHSPGIPLLLGSLGAVGRKALKQELEGREVRQNEGEKPLGPKSG